MTAITKLLWKAFEPLPEFPISRNEALRIILAKSEGEIAIPPPRRTQERGPITMGPLLRKEE